MLRLCLLVPLSTRELANLLGLNDQYVRSLLKQLMERGVVAYLYPDTLNHPAQRYRAGRIGAKIREDEESR